MGTFCDRCVTCRKISPSKKVSESFEKNPLSCNNAQKWMFAKLFYGNLFLKAFEMFKHHYFTHPLSLSHSCMLIDTCVAIHNNHLLSVNMFKEFLFFFFWVITIFVFFYNEQHFWHCKIIMLGDNKDNMARTIKIKENEEALKVMADNYLQMT